MSKQWLLFYSILECAFFPQDWTFCLSSTRLLVLCFDGVCILCLICCLTVTTAFSVLVLYLQTVMTLDHFTLTTWCKMNSSTWKQPSGEQILSNWLHILFAKAVWLSLCYSHRSCNFLVLLVVVSRFWTRLISPLPAITLWILSS